MTRIELQYSCAHSIVSLRSWYAIPCTGIMYLYSTRTVLASCLRQWLMRCDVRAAIAQIEIADYGMEDGSGVRYEGQVNWHGKNGKGVMSWSGGRYVGEFRDHCYHGHGTFTWADGRAPKSGKWDKDRFLG